MAAANRRSTVAGVGPPGVGEGRSWRHRFVVVAVGLLLAAVGHPAPALADAFGAEVTILTIHTRAQRDAPVELYARRLDSRGQFVLTPGLEVYYDFDLERPLWKAKQIRIAGGQLSDSIQHRFGYLAVMARWVVWEGERSAWSIQFGPGMIYRESWVGTPGYNPDNPLRRTDSFLPGYEWAILPLGDVDYLYRFTPTLQGVWSTFPGIPYVIMQSLGLRWSF